MAYTKPVTWLQLQSLLQSAIEQNTDTPDTDDVAYWLTVVNRLIADWEEEREWDELWTFETSGGTVTANDTTYGATAAVKKFSENIELHYTNGTIEYVPIVDTSDKQYWTRTAERFAYITGVAGSYVVNLGWTPATTDAAIGATIKYPYYKFATKLSANSDVVEMSDPNWLLDATVSEVSNQPFKKQLFAARASAKMRLMKSNAENETEDATVPDDETGFGI